MCVALFGAVQGIAQEKVRIPQTPLPDINWLILPFLTAIILRLTCGFKKPVPSFYVSINIPKTEETWTHFVSESKV